MDASVVGVGVGLAGLVGGYLLAVLKGAATSRGQRIDAKITERLSDRSKRRAAAAKASAVAAEKAAGEKADAELRARLEAERIGARFLRRYTAEDPGMDVTVLKLGRDWKQTVLVEETSPEARVATDLDDRNPRTEIEWSRLSRPDFLQREHTAGRIRSYDPADGWLEFERVR